jgi:hypothetical protein
MELLIKRKRLKDSSLISCASSFTSCVAFGDALMLKVGCSLTKIRDKARHKCDRN